MPKTLDTVCPACGAHLKLARRDVRTFEVEVVPPAAKSVPPAPPDEETSLLDDIFGDDET